MLITGALKERKYNLYIMHDSVLLPLTDDEDEFAIELQHRNTFEIP